MSQDPVTRAQQRENEDPEEAVRPMPVAALLVAAGMVVWAVIYILNTEPLNLSQFGDQRTRAELSGPVAAAGGAVDGKALYAAQCAACHQATGAGLPGVFPPLDGSEWVQGEPRVLANILLHGVSGKIEVAGQSFDGMMPAFAQLSDAEIAGVLTHIRSTWGNQAEAISADFVASEREAGSARTTPFEGGEALKALIK